MARYPPAKRVKVGSIPTCTSYEMKMVNIVYKMKWWTLSTKWLVVYHKDLGIVYGADPLNVGDMRFGQDEEKHMLEFVEVYRSKGWTVEVYDCVRNMAFDKKAKAKAI